MPARHTQHTEDWEPSGVNAELAHSKDPILSNLLECSLYFQALPPTLYFSFAAYLLPAWHFCLDDENVGQTGHFQHCITSHSFPKSLPLLHFQGPKIGGSLGKYLGEILAFILASCCSPLKDIYFLLSSLDSQSKYDHFLFKVLLFIPWKLHICVWSILIIHTHSPPIPCRFCNPSSSKNFLSFS